MAGDFGQSLEIAPDRSDYSGGNSIKGVKGADMKGNERGRVGEEEDEYLDQLTLEQIEANRGQFERTNQLVHQFMLNEGPQLQRDLKEYANKCQNWVSLNFIHYNCILVVTIRLWVISVFRVLFLFKLNELLSKPLTC